MYLAWFDANPKKPIAQKIDEARERYIEKFGHQPRVCLVNPGDMVPESAVELRPLAHIGRHSFWIGTDDADEPEVAAPVALPTATPAPKRRAKREKAAA